MTSLDRAKGVNAAEWIDLSVRALGGATHSDGSVWWRGPDAPGIYPAAVIAGAPESPDRAAAAVARALAGWDDRRFTVWDVGATVDLRGVGLHRVWTRPWLARAPSPLVAGPRAVALSRVTDAAGLAAYERASKIGFESEDDVERWHAAATLDDARVVHLVGRVGDAVVTSGCSYASADLVGIYGISTPPPERRRGHARSLVERLVALHAGATLGVWPDPVSVPIYADAGFVAAGEVALWIGP